VSRLQQELKKTGHSHSQDTINEDRERTRKELDVARDEVKAQFENAARSSEGSFRDVRTRMDTFLTLTFTVLAGLFAGLGIIATRTPEQPGFLSPTVWVSALALFFALRAETRGKRHSWLSSGAVALLVTAAAVLSLAMAAQHR